MTAEALFADPRDQVPETPVPPLRLRRVRLHGVGPDGARFDPLDLDFATEDGAASRVLLSLTNTGGKSTLITLLCSVVVPASRAQIGGKVLGDYVLNGDTSHVVCEWEDSTTGSRVVTGTVMEWKDGRRQPAHAMRSTTNMHRAWYLFHTGAGLPGIDDLPFVLDGRRVPYRDFHSVVGDLIGGNPRTQGVITDKQQDWTTALEERTSIDPTLFTYQMRMNDSEAGAEKLLSSFDSPDHVVRFFVAALNDQRELETFTGKLGTYAQLAAQRADLEALAAWGAEVAPLLDQISECAARSASATGLADNARAVGSELAGAIDNRIEQDQRSLAGLDSAVAVAAEALTEARRAYGQVSDIRRQLLFEQARAESADAERAQSTAKLAVAAARRDEEAWRAVDLVIDLQTEREALVAAQLAYDAADAGLGPLRQEVVQAAGRVAGRIDALIQENTEAAVEADDLARVYGQLADAEQTKATNAVVRAHELAGQLDQIDELVSEADAARATAVTDQWLEAGERLDAALRRWRATQVEADRLAADAREVVQRANAAYAGAMARLRECEPRLVECHNAAGQAQDRLSRLDADLAELAEDATVEHLGGARPRDAAAVRRVVGVADAAASDADGDASNHESVAVAARVEIAHLDETGTAPTGPDVRVVLEILLAAQVWAVTGLSWIERNLHIPDDRAVYIAGNPGLAGGVVVSDPTRFDEAVRVLDEHPPHTRTPVTVTVAPANTRELPGDATRLHIVVPHRATWDRNWAEHSRAELVEAERSASAAATTAKTAAARYRAASAACSAFLRQWAEPGRDELARHADAAAAELAELEQRVTGLRAEHEDAYKLAQEMSAQQAEHQAAAARAARCIEKTEELITQLAVADKAAARRPGIVLQERQARLDSEAAVEARRQAQRDSRSAIGRAASHRAIVEPLGRERAETGVDQSTPDPGGSIDALRSARSRLRHELSAAETGMVEASRLEDAGKRVSAANERLRPFSEDAKAAAYELSGTVEASSQMTRTDAVQRAVEALDTARRELSSADSRVKQAHQNLSATQPSGGHQNHFDLAGTEWAPATPDDISVLLGRLDERNIELRDVRDAAEQTHTEAKELRDEVRRDITSFTDTSGLWTADKVATVDIFTGTRDFARTEMRGRISAYNIADKAAGKAAAELHQAVVEARKVANQPRWTHLEAPAVVRLRGLSEDDLTAEAPTLTARIRVQSESAAADLRELDQHRTILRDSLQSLCREQRRLLREVSRSSQLPDGLGDISHQPAIKIRFDDAPDNEAAAGLARRIDTWAVELGGDPRRAKSADVRTRWLADAVRDTVVDRPRAGAWTIEILKPRIDGQVVYCPPDRIPAEFSGGQVLTLAVLVYCALSRVRAAHRQGGARPPGTLLLDNPFGTASAEALIDMQHRLAAHSGVQLVCATGLHDPAVDSAFTGPRSVIVKLRNDGDLRRNLSFLRLHTAVVDGTDVADRIRNGRSPAAPQNWVDATRYEVDR